MLDIAVHGDILEKNYALFIRAYIPAYEQIWMRYIGNDGTAQMMNLPALTEEENKRRKLFSQYHYSLLESSVCLKRIVETKLFFLPETLDEYLDLTSLFLSFQAHTGRIRDCIKKMGEQFTLIDLYDKLDNFYKQRNESLHGCKIPFMIIDGFISIPHIKGTDEDPLKWHDTLTWDEAEKLNFKPINDYMSVTFSQLLPVVNSCLYQLFEKIKEFVSKKNIDYKSFEQSEGISWNQASARLFPEFPNIELCSDSSSFVKTDIKIADKKDKRHKKRKNK